MNEGPAARKRDLKHIMAVGKFCYYLVKKKHFCSIQKFCFAGHHSFPTRVKTLYSNIRLIFCLVPDSRAGYHTVFSELLFVCLFVCFHLRIFRKIPHDIIA